MNFMKTFHFYGHDRSQKNIGYFWEPANLLLNKLLISYCVKAVLQIYCLWIYIFFIIALMFLILYKLNEICLDDSRFECSFGQVLFIDYFSIVLCLFQWNCSWIYKQEIVKNESLKINVDLNFWFLGSLNYPFPCEFFII